MCGLCGSFTQQGRVLSKREKVQRARALEGLIIANQVRGTDSTGIAAIDYDGHYDIYKRAIEPWKFVNDPKAQQIMRSNAPLMIGHTRMTSMGKDVRDENAHPFLEGNIIGAHNGVINNYIELDHTVRVDSQAVLRELDANEDAYDYAFSKVSGSCALTWWDMRSPDALFLVAHMNPLAVAIVPRIKTLFWSSVTDHLESIMRASYGNDVDFVQIKQNTIYRIGAQDIYAWQEGSVHFGTNAYTSTPTTGAYRGYTGAIFGDDEDYINGYGMSGRAVAPKATTPPTMSDEEEARYEAYWDRLMASGHMENRSEDEDALNDVSNTPERFQIDDLDNTLICGYCDGPLGEKGAWDQGLELLLCKRCQSWWDNFGYAKELESTVMDASNKKYPITVV